jgi:aminomethyltransferase
MVPFGDWDMPVQYRDPGRAPGGAVCGGLFDVSHMGEVEFRGPGALAALQRLTSNDAARLQVGQVQYSALTTPDGTFVDDLTVYRLAEDRYLVTLNAANIEKDLAWMRAHAAGAVIEDQSDATALVAIQGPRASAILQALTAVDLAAIPYYWFARGMVLGRRPLGQGTQGGRLRGIRAHRARRRSNALVEEGPRRTPAPRPRRAGHPALEAKMALYGSDIDADHTVLEADLGWIVKLQKGEFIGRDALARQKAEGVTRKLVGFEMEARGIARSHYAIVKDGVRIGDVTSGAPSPWLHKPIGLGYVAIAHAAVGTPIEILIRDQPVAARIVPTPFYKRPR